MEKKKYFVIIEHKISDRVIERAMYDHPYPNADGTIDWLKENYGEWDSIAGISVDNHQEVIDYLERCCPTIYKEDDIRITRKRINREGSGHNG